MSLPAPEATGFSFAEPEAEPAPFPIVEPEPEAAAETVMFPFPQPEPLVEPSPELSPFADAFPPPPAPEAPAAIPDAPSFTMDAPRRKPTDTVPGDRPVYVPPPPEPEPLPATVYEMPAPTAFQAPEIGTPAPVPASRPTQEDLAALDALLNPSASGRLPRTPVDRPQPEKWEPQFRPPTTPPRKAPARAAASSPSRAPIFIGVAVVGILLASAGAWYFFLRAPSPAAAPSPEPTTIAAATPAPTAEPTDEPTVEPTVEPTAAPTEEPPAATPPPAPVATPTPAPRPTPTPGSAPATTAAPAGDGRALLRQGSLPEASRAFAAALAPGSGGRYSLQLLVACAPETVTKAVGAVSSEELFILPVSVKGRACYRLGWGVYDGRPAAEAALSSVPSYFRQGGMAPRVAPLGELLP